MAQIWIGMKSGMELDPLLEIVELRNEETSSCCVVPVMTKYSPTHLIHFSRTVTHLFLNLSFLSSSHSCFHLSHLHLMCSLISYCIEASQFASWFTLAPSVLCPSVSSLLDIFELIKRYSYSILTD